MKIKLKCRFSTVDGVDSAPSAQKGRKWAYRGDGVDSAPSRPILTVSIQHRIYISTIHLNKMILLIIN